MSAGINIWNAAVDVGPEVFWFFFLTVLIKKSDLDPNTFGSRGHLFWAGVLQRSLW